MGLDVLGAHGFGGGLKKGSRISAYALSPTYVNQVAITQSANNGDVHSVAEDSNGNIYSGSENSQLMKYDSAGTAIWTVATSITTHVIVDSNDNIHVGSGYDLDKLDVLGNVIWTERLSRSPIWGLTIGSDGAIYIGAGIEVYKVNTSGVLVWSVVTGDGNGIVSSDYDGNLYIARHGIGESVVVLDTSGTTVNTFNIHSNYVYGVAVDANGNMYTGSRDSTLKKTNQLGNLVWSATQDYYVMQVVIDKNDNIYASVDVGGSNYDSFRRYYTDGTMVFANRENPDGIWAVFVNDKGMIFTGCDDMNVRKFEQYNLYLGE